MRLILAWQTDKGWARSLSFPGHFQTGQPRVESKPATLSCVIHTGFLDAGSGYLNFLISSLHNHPGQP